MVLSAVILLLSLLVDRFLGDPQSRYHPVSLLGTFIGWWGRPDICPAYVQQAFGVLMWIATAALFALPFYLFSTLAPWYLLLLIGPFLLKVCFAWRSLEEHTHAVADALSVGLEAGKEKAALLVSRDTAWLTQEQILSAGYESMTENLVDSIVSPLLYFAVFGFTGSAVFRAANTMDAMLGYRDERERIGWFSARMDDLLNFIPARLTVLLLLVYFAAQGRAGAAWRVMQRDGGKRPGYNGGIVMAAMAGGAGVRFEKPGVYVIGDRERSLEAAGEEIVHAVRAVTVIFAGIAASALFLLAMLAIH
jgi:adenosylcobinamide-phosphate synthase